MVGQTLQSKSLVSVMKIMAFHNGQFFFQKKKSGAAKQYLKLDLTVHIHKWPKQSSSTGFPSPRKVVEIERSMLTSIIMGMCTYMLMRGACVPLRLLLRNLSVFKCSARCVIE